MTRATRCALALFAAVLIVFLALAAEPRPEPSPPAAPGLVPQPVEALPRRAEA